MTVSNIDNLRRQLPSVDVVVQQLGDLIESLGQQQVTTAVRYELNSLRTMIDKGQTPKISFDDINTAVRNILNTRNQSSLRPVINLTGTVLHTNLGRAVLPQVAIDAVVSVSQSPSNLEFDLDCGIRGDRDVHIEQLVCELTGAEAATAVNNNAAAVLLVLNTLALDAEVPVSRGELVEIGGSFRIPEVMHRSGCRLVEVGATNRTHLKDYEKVIGDETALLMKVHTSNYRIEGFTHAVGEQELATLAHQHRLPFMIDLGSGNLVDFAALSLPNEPSAAKAIAKGADIITFSGDKLLGGPQCGIIAGRRDLLEQIRNNPLKRALRLDKMTLAALIEVLKLHRNPKALLVQSPTLRQLTRPLDDINAQAQRVLPIIESALNPDFTVAIGKCFSQIGSGALPVETIPSIALEIASVAGDDEQLRDLARTMRQLPYPVIVRHHKNKLRLDLRCLECEAEFVAQLKQLCKLL